MKYIFRDDYSEGCHPDILKALSDTNMAQTTPYGTDIYSEQARNSIRNLIGDDTMPIFFVSGGTLANLIMISSALRPHEAVISAHTGHINSKEVGAIEATGHKIIQVMAENGKLTPDDIVKSVEENTHVPHMAKPRMVYITNTTEVGTIYQKHELEAISETCKAHNLLLMLDGARLGTALTCNDNDTTLSDIARLTDIFWMGGTKNGALFGEAIIIPNRDLAVEFEFHIKQRGALLAKGRALGVQFHTLFKDGLYFELAKRANQMAQKISGALVENGFEMPAPTQTNLMMAILPNAVVDRLQEEFDFYLWKKLDNDRTMVRLVTSWASDEKQVERFVELLNKEG